MSDQQLPEGWHQARLEDVVEILDSRRVPVNSAERSGRLGSIPYYGATGQVGWIDDHLFDEELVLLGEDGAPFLEDARQKAYVIRGKTWVNNHAHVLRALGGSPSPLWKHQLDLVDYRPFVSGTTRLKLPQAPMRQIPLVVPPLPEQHRIVAAIEDYFSRLDEAVALLERVQRNLKRYRASVLKAAVEGRLVPTEAELARAEGRTYEPASVLLERILEERRRRWEQSGRKGKYQEPAAPDTTDLPELPEGWCWASLQQIFDSITDGDHQPPPQTAAGIPLLVIGNVRSGKVDFTGTRFVTKQYYNSIEGSRRPQRGDVLFTVTGSFGIPLLVDTDRPFCVQRHIAILRPCESTSAAYFTHVLRSTFVFSQAWKVATGTAQMTVPLGGLRQIVVPVPPWEEQGRILSELERRASLLDEADQLVRRNSLRCTRLRQSILKWAFEGRLADQDPTDEPTSVLLERIRAERAASDAAPKAARRGRPRRQGTPA